jgi:hypothetical protein
LGGPEARISLEELLRDLLRGLLNIRGKIRPIQEIRLPRRNSNPWSISSREAR